MKIPALLFPVPVVLFVAGCGIMENPQLAMCQTITKNLVGEISEWPSTETKESGDRLTISANYTLAAGDSGEVKCLYQREMQNSDSSPAAFRTAPTEVALNGTKISEKQLFLASTGASREKLQELASEAAEQVKEINQDVTKKAEQITDQAEAALRDAEKKVGEAATDISEKALKAASEAVDKLKDTLDKQ